MTLVSVFDWHVACLGFDPMERVRTDQWIAETRRRIEDGTLTPDPPEYLENKILELEAEMEAEGRVPEYFPRSYGPHPGAYRLKEKILRKYERWYPEKTS